MSDDLISRKEAIELIERMKPFHQDVDDIAEMIANMPPAQPEIIRCKDCVNHCYHEGIPYCMAIDYGYGWKDDDFCSHGERREEDAVD